MKASVYTHTKLNGNESTLQVFVKSQAQIGLKLELRGKGKNMRKYHVHLPCKRVFEDKNVEGWVGMLTEWGTAMNSYFHTHSLWFWLSHELLSVATQERSHMQKKESQWQT